MLLPDYQELVELKNAKGTLSLHRRSKSLSIAAGQQRSLFKGRGLDFSEFREYTPGDDIRAIDWKVTAKTGRAHTKLFIEERERSVYILIDTNSYMQFGTRQTFKSVQAARVSALIAWRAHQLNDKIGAILFGNFLPGPRFLPAKRSRQSIWELLKLLSIQTSAHHRTSICEALQLANQTIPKGSSIFIVSDFFEINGEFERLLGILSRKSDVTLIKVIDPADEYLPNVGEVKFTGTSEEEMLVDTDDEIASELYRKSWAERNRALKEMSEKFRVRLAQIYTNRDIVTDLLSESK
jgi:uncharacterized protein (DUF58 family)